MSGCFYAKNASTDLREKRVNCRFPPSNPPQSRTNVANINAQQRRDPPIEFHNKSLEARPLKNLGMRGVNRTGWGGVGKIRFCDPGYMLSSGPPLQVCARKSTDRDSAKPQVGLPTHETRGLQHKAEAARITGRAMITAN